LFRVMPDGEGVKLVAFEAQQRYQTSAAAPPAAAPPVAFTFAPTNLQAKTSEAGGQLRFVASKPIQSIGGKKLVRPADGVAAGPVLEGDRITVELAADKKTLTLTLPTLEAGAYRLDLSIILEGSQNRQGESIPIKVQAG